MTKRQKLNEMQQKFLDVLFDEAQGDLQVAAQLAGYSETTRGSQVAKNLKEEIHELTLAYLATNAPKAAVKLTNLMDKPTTLGGETQLKVIKDLLDRANAKTAEKVEVKAETPLFILPNKEK